MSTLYEDLGVDKEATADEIRKAYKKKAMQHHPDKDGDAIEFVKVAKAYEVLADPQRRAEYDKTGNSSNIEDPAHVVRRTAAEMILQAVEAHQIEHAGIIMACSDYVRQVLNNIKQQQTTVEESIKKLESAAKRLKTKNGEDFMAQVIASHISQKRQQILAGDKQIEQSMLILEFLGNCEFENDEPAPVPSVSGLGMWRAVNTKL
jgi:DnaJ-domain-containing protein 1